MLSRLVVAGFMKYPGQAIARTIDKTKLKTDVYGGKMPSGPCSKSLVQAQHISECNENANGQSSSRGNISLCSRDLPSTFDQRKNEVHYAPALVL